MQFLPKNYKEPITSNYMKFADGANPFRVLSSASIGFVWWEDTKDGGRKPIRVKTEDEIPSETAMLDGIKHFWAFVVWNFNDERVQILEVTQVTIREGIKALVVNAKWGDPKEYNIVVLKKGEGMETKYQVTPEPKEKLDKVILEKYKGMNINLEALFGGEDPFGVKEDEVDIEEADKEIG